MKHYLFLATAALAAIGITGCQMLCGEPSTPDAVFAKMEKAIDPDGKLPSIHAAMFVYTAKTGKAEEQLRLQWKSPLMLRVESVTPSSVVIKGYDGKTGWEYYSGKGLRMLHGSELAHLRFQAGFLAPDIRIKDLFEKITLEGEAEVDGTKCWQALCIPRPDYKMRPITMFIAKDSGLLMKTMEPQQCGNETVNVVTLFGNYKSYGGIMVPESMIAQADEQIQSCTLTTVKWNDAIADCEFSAPRPLGKK